MEYELANVITNNAIFTSNEDGSLTAKGVAVQTKIVGAYEGKFLQTDQMPPFNIPADETSATQPAYIQAQATAFVAEKYPNT